MRQRSPVWINNVKRCEEVQADLCKRLVVQSLPALPRFIVGTDAAYFTHRNAMAAAAVVYDCVKARLVEVKATVRSIEFPYIPGLLSFREGPALIEVIQRLEHPYEVILFDGQGYAHPRRCGLASHLSLMMDFPGIGVAKSRLVGTFIELPSEKGASVPLMDNAEVVGLVVRTQAKVKPLFVSIGHRMDLESALKIVLKCCHRYRIPEPIRLAHLEVERLKRCLDPRQYGCRDNFTQKANCLTLQPSSK